MDTLAEKRLIKGNSDKLYIAWAICIIIKMHYNEQQSHKDFLVPSSIPRILQSNRQSCALQTDRSTSTLRTSGLSPKHKQSLTEYTFEPRINSSNKKPRSIDKFVEDQLKYQQEKERKLTEMRDEVTRWEEEEARHIPQINSITKGHLSSDNEHSVSVFQRLSKQKPAKEVTRESWCFSPEILPKSKYIQRDKQVTDLLYEDAKKRSSKQKLMLQSHQKKLNALASPKINSNTNDLVRKKVLAEFMNLISDEFMNPLLALSVLEEIFNVKLRDISSSPVRKLVELISNQHGDVPTEKLWSFIAVILGDGDGIFPPEQQSFIKIHYGYFYKERINKEKKRATPEVPKFEPKILENSATLAEKHRDRLCRRASDFIANQNPRLNIEEDTIALEDLFIIEHMQRLKENQRLKMEKQNQELLQCTFKPTISTSKPLTKPKQKIILKHPLRQREVNGQTTTSDATRPNPATKRVVSAERSVQETRGNPLSSQKKADILKRNRRSIDNLSMRMMLGRTTRDFQNKMTCRGYSKNESWMQAKMRSHKLIMESCKMVGGLHQC